MLSTSQSQFRFKISCVQPQERFTPMLPQSASKAKSQYTHRQGMKVLQFTRVWPKKQQFTFGAPKSVQHLRKIGCIWQVSLQKVVISTINTCSLCQWDEKHLKHLKDMGMTQSHQQSNQQSNQPDQFDLFKQYLPDLAWCLQGFDQWAGSPTCRMNTHEIQTTSNDLSHVQASHLSPQAASNQALSKSLSGWNQALYSRLLQEAFQNSMKTHEMKRSSSQPVPEYLQKTGARSSGRSTPDQEILPSHPRLRWWAVGSPDNFPMTQSANLKDLTSDMFHKTFCRILNLKSLKYWTGWACHMCYFSISQLPPGLQRHQFALAKHLLAPATSEASPVHLASTECIAGAEHEWIAVRGWTPGNHPNPVPSGNLDLSPGKSPNVQKKHRVKLLKCHSFPRHSQ